MHILSFAFTLGPRFEAYDDHAVIAACSADHAPPGYSKYIFDLWDGTRNFFDFEHDLFGAFYRRRSRQRNIGHDGSGVFAGYKRFWAGYHQVIEYAGKEQNAGQGKPFSPYQKGDRFLILIG